MIRNNVYYELFASDKMPNPEQVGYWIDLGANSKGKIIKVFNPNIKQWVKVTDATSEDAVSPKIGGNGNWFVDSRDTGIPASGKNPFIRDNKWFVYDPAMNKYVDTGIYAKGNSAYDIAVSNGFIGTQSEWLDYLRKPAVDAAEEASEVLDGINTAIEKVDIAVEESSAAVEAANNAVVIASEVSSNPMKIVDN